MRLVLAMVLAGLVALPLSASAQEAEEGWLEEFYPELAPREPPHPPPREPASSSEPAPDEPALQLKLDDAGVEVAPSYPPRFDEMELRVKRARTGLIVNSAILVVGVALTVGGAVYDARNPPDPNALLTLPNGYLIAGIVLVPVGSIGMIVSGVMLGVRKGKLRRLQQAHYGTPRRVHWDLAQSRLVF